MKILLLHLSDIHFKSKTNPVASRASKIAATTFSRIHSARVVFVVVSGDVAFSGTCSEYEAASAFLKQIKDAIAKEFDGPIHFIIAPGNHDCDFTGDQSIRETLIEKVLESNGQSVTPAIVEECIKVQTQFRTFRKYCESQDNISKDDALWTLYTFDIEGYKVVFDCLNVAWMSQRKEIQGHLFFPVEQFEDLKSETSYLRIAILHHPLNWYSEKNHRPLRKLVRSLAHIVVTGHEHHTNIGETIDTESDHSVYIEGGVLQVSDSDVASKFNLVELDLSSSMYLCEVYSWNGSIYESQEHSRWKEYRPLPRKKAHKLTLTDDFSKKLEDPGGNFNHPGKESLSLSDIFVFPDLRVGGVVTEKLKDTVNSGVLRDSHLLSNGVIIKGEEKTGRTSLIYQLFTYFYDSGSTPLLLQGSDIKSNKSNMELSKTIERAAIQQYGKESLARFKQVPTAEKIVFVDDFDANKLTSSQRTEIVTFLRREFNGILITVSDLFEFDEAVSESAIHPLVGFREYELLEFGHKLRFDLIRKWTALGAGTGRDDADVVAALDQTEKALNALVGHNLVPRVPIYLLMLLQSFELGRDTVLQNSAFGECYRFLIMGALDRAGVKPVELQEYRQFCCLLSWEFCQLDVRELEEAKLRVFNDEFSKKYHRREFSERIGLLIDGQIFKKQGELYSFRYPYIYYFFLGKYLADNLNESGIREFVERYCRHLYIRDYANTILFLAHHSSASFVYERIEDVLKGLFADQIEFDFERDTKELVALMDSAPKLALRSGHVVDNRRDAAKIRDEISTVNDPGTGELRGNAEEDGLSLLSKLMLLFKTIEILGLILKNQYATIQNSEKKRLLDETFKGPLRALKVFFDCLAGEGVGLVSELERIIAKHDSSIGDEKRKRLARDAVFFLVGAISFASVRRIAASVGSEHMREVISVVAEETDSDTYRLIELAVKLDAQGAIPWPLIKELVKRTDGNIFSRHILQRLIMNHLYMFKTRDADKQKLCGLLDISMATQRAIDLTTKNAKRLK